MQRQTPSLGYDGGGRGSLRDARGAEIKNSAHKKAR